MNTMYVQLNNDGKTKISGKWAILKGIRNYMDYANKIIAVSFIENETSFWLYNPILCTNYKSITITLPPTKQNLLYDVIPGNTKFYHYSHNTYILICCNRLEYEWFVWNKIVLSTNHSFGELLKYVKNLFNYDQGLDFRDFLQEVFFIYAPKLTIIQVEGKYNSSNQELEFFTPNTDLIEEIRKHIADFLPQFD